MYKESREPLQASWDKQTDMRVWLLLKWAFVNDLQCSDHTLPKYADGRGANSCQTVRMALCCGVLRMRHAQRNMCGIGWLLFSTMCSCSTSPFALKKNAGEGNSPPFARWQPTNAWRQARSVGLLSQKGTAITHFPRANRHLAWWCPISFGSCQGSKGWTAAGSWDLGIYKLTRRRAFARLRGAFESLARKGLLAFQSSSR